MPKIIKLLPTKDKVNVMMGRLIEAVFLMILVAFFVFMIAGAFNGGDQSVSDMAQSGCIQHGFPDFVVSDDVIYCVRIVNGSHQVVRFDFLGQ